MNNKQIQDALASAFLDAGLTVRVVHARSTDSIYLTASNDAMPYTVRIANHKQSRYFSTVDDYWIDTTRKNVVDFINSAIGGASHRFNRPIQEYVPPEAPEPLSEKVVQTRDNYSRPMRCEWPTQNLIDLAQYYVNEGYMPEINNNPEKVSPVYEDASKSAYNEGRMMMWVALIVAAIVILFYCLH